MRFLFLKLQSRVVLFAIVLAIPVLGIAIFLLRHALDRHEGTAAWVQAGGSLLIIAATAWLSQRELLRANQREEQAKSAVRKSCAVLACRCLETVDRVIQRLPVAPTSDYQAEKTRAYAPSDLELVMDSLAAIPVHHLGDVTLITSVLELRAVMGRVKRFLDLGMAEQLTRMSRNDLNPNLRGEIFNKVAGVVRSVGGFAAEKELSALASFVEHPRRAI